MTSGNFCFLLKSINVQEILEQYLDGKFNENLPMFEIENFKREFTTENLVKTGDDFYIINLRGHPKGYQACCNEKSSFETFEKTGKLSFNQPCEICGEKSTMGYPYEHRETYTNIDGKFHIVHIFWVEGSCCSYQCCERACPPNLLKLLHLMHKIANPDVEIYSGDFPFSKNLQRKKSCIPIDVWRLQKTPFRPTGRIILAPIKREFYSDEVS